MTKEQEKVEELLRDYFKDMKRLKFWRDMLKEDSSVSVSCDSVSARSVGNYSEPVPSWLDRRTNWQEMITGLEAKTRPITSLLEHLKSSSDVDDAKLANDLEVCFGKKVSQKQIADTLHISIRSVYNLRKSLVTKVMDFLQLSNE